MKELKKASRRRNKQRGCFINEQLFPHITYRGGRGGSEDSAVLVISALGPFLTAGAGVGVGVLVGAVIRSEGVGEPPAGLGPRFGA